MRIAAAGKLAEKAGRLLRVNDLDRAEMRYLKALVIWPVHPRALAGMASICLKRGDGAHAVRWAAVLVREQPRRPYNHLLLGNAYELTGDRDSARQAWRGAARRGNTIARERLRETRDRVPDGT
jgi:Flp pilus assembly protein TadD